MRTGKEADVFESAMGRYEAASGRLGTGAILSIAAHAFVVAGVLLFSGQKPKEKIEAPEIVFQAAKPPPLLGTPGGSPKTEQPKTKKPPRPKNKIVPILTNEPPKQPEQPNEPEENTASASDTEGPGNGGDPNGSPDGVPGGTGPVVPAPPPPPPEPPPTSTVMSFTGDMQRPVLISGPSQPEYPQNAKSERIEGIVIARCVITAEGDLNSCAIIKGHPFLNPAVEAMLAKQRYRPLLYNGKPVSVRYVFQFNFKLQ